MPSEEDKTEEEKTPTQTEDEEDEDGDSELAKAGKSFRRKLKNETHYTSGLGKTKTKQKILEEFNNLVVPELEKIGWKKEDGTGLDEGLVVFYSNDHVPVVFKRIRAVIDRIREGKTEEEKKIADDFQKALGSSIDFNTIDAPAPNRPKLPFARARRNASQAKAKSAAASSGDAWKEGRAFPKRSSRIGFRYQVEGRKFPKAGTHEEPNSQGSEEFLEVLWDPTVAKEKGALKDDGDVIKDLPYNLKEAGLVALAEVGYNVDAFKEKAEKLAPADGSDFTPAQRERFHREIFRYRKDLRAVAKAMRIPTKVCIAYYLGTYKSSDNYRLLKTVCVEETTSRVVSDNTYDACAVCGDGGELVICDFCEGEFHMECLRPQLASIPEGHWECDECVDRKFLAVREYLIRNTRMFEATNKRPLEETEGRWYKPSEVMTVEYRPTEPVLKSVRRFANSVADILAKKPHVDKNPDAPTPMDVDTEAAAAAEETTAKAEAKADDETMTDAAVAAEPVKTEN